MAAQASEELEKLKCKPQLLLHFCVVLETIVLIVIASERPEWSYSRASSRCR